MIPGREASIVCVAVLLVELKMSGHQILLGTAIVGEISSDSFEQTVCVDS